MNKLRELRLKKGISIKQASEDLGIAPTYLSQLETGARKLSRNMIKTFCEYYKILPNELLGYSDVMSVIDESDNEFSKEDIRLMRALKSLSDEDHKELKVFIDYLVYKHEKRLMANDKEKYKN